MRPPSWGWDVCRPARVATERSYIRTLQARRHIGAPRAELFVNDALDVRGPDDAVRRLVVAGVVSRLLAVTFHLLIALVRFPDAFGFVLVFAGNRHHRQVVVVLVQGEPPLRC